MRVPTLAGQYRHVRYSEDGCSIYSCCWCDRTIEIRDNPYRYSFCPLCGKSWFTRLRCRDQETPKWAWDKYGDEIPHTVRLRPNYKQGTHEWIFEIRTKLGSSEWGKWGFEGRLLVGHGELGHWRGALRRLRGFRARSDDREDFVEFEYRARLDKRR